MGTVIAALDDSAAAAPVVATARSLAELFGATVEALTVRTNAAGTEAAAAAASPASRCARSAASRSSG